MLGTRHFPKIAKINFQQEKTICPLIAKLVPAKHKTSPRRKNKHPQKKSCQSWFSNVYRRIPEHRCRLKNMTECIAGGNKFSETQAAKAPFPLFLKITSGS